MREPKGLALSPDGKQLYVAASEGANGGPLSYRNGAVVIFDRNSDTGVLTQKAGTAGCINTGGDDGSGAGTCGVGRALHDANRLAVSPDGKNLYVAAQGDNNKPQPQPVGALSVFSRSADTGELTQLDGIAGCWSSDGTNGYGGPLDDCTKGRGMNEPTGVALSPDGANVYLASGDSPGTGMGVFWRNPSTGALTQLDGPSGCLTRGGLDADGTVVCTNVNGADGGNDVLALPATVKAGCANVYMTAADDNALSSYNRDAECSSPAPVTEPPLVTTGNATDVVTNGAVLHGTVDANGGATTYVFQFGFSALYGVETVAQTLPATTGGQAVTATISGLEDGRTYHYRLIASNSGGTAFGADKTFTTPSKARKLPLGLTLNVSGGAASARAASVKAYASAGTYRYSFSGRLRLPQGVTKGAACSGVVSIRIRARKQTISNRRALVRRNCGYAQAVTFQIPKRFFKAKTLEVRAIFGGNGRLKPIKSKAKMLPVR
jgi:DNA-binding beta-propeller fold protein YncE